MFIFLLLGDINQVKGTKYFLTQLNLDWWVLNSNIHEYQIVLTIFDSNVLQNTEKENNKNNLLVHNNVWDRLQEYYEMQTFSK